MNKYFKYEEELVKTFKSFINDDRNIIIQEMPIRWGNIDLISIKNAKIPFSSEQCKLLSKPSAAKIFLKIKKNRPISKKTLSLEIGLSENTINLLIRELIKQNLIKKVNDLYYRNIDFEFPKVTVTGYEAKLHDYNKTLFQASINKNYVDYSYMVFPMDIANKIFYKNKHILKNEGIGIIGVTEQGYKIILKANIKNELKNYIRLINLVQSSLLST